MFLTLDIIYPLQKYYNGYGTFDWKLDSISMAPFAVRIGILSMDLFVTFFPFIGVIAYAGTIIDERKDGYCYQIIQKRGFHSYYWSHFVASGLLGGLLPVAILIMLISVDDLGIGQNPLWKDAITSVSYTRNLDRKTRRFILASIFLQNQQDTLNLYCWEWSASF